MVQKLDMTSDAGSPEAVVKLAVPGARQPVATVTGSLLADDGTTPVVFPDIPEAGKLSGRRSWFSTTYRYALWWDVELSPARWSLFDHGGDAPASWYSLSDVETPDLATGWTPVSLNTGTPVITISDGIPPLVTPQKLAL